MGPDGSVAGRHSRRHLAGGTAWGLLGEGLALPTGLVTAAVLTRAFGPADYGLYALTIGLVSLIQAGINSLLVRATIKFTSQADDPAPVARSVLRIHLVAGLVAGVVVVAAAPLAADLLHEARLGRLIRIFSLSLPLETLAQAHVGLLIGTARYRERALVRSLYWIARVTLIVTLVLLGYGIVGALVGALAASLAAILLARRWLDVSWLGSAVPMRPLLAFGLPLFVAGVAGLARRRLDLFALKSLGGTAADAGLYAAAQTLALVPGILATSLGPLVLSTLTRSWVRGDREGARELGRDLLRAGFWLIPAAGLVAGASDEIMGLVYGPEFSAAGPVLAILFLAVSTVFFASTCNSILIVTDSMGAVLATSIVPLLVALALFPILIPALARTGAALSSLAAAGVGLALALGLVWRVWRVAPPAPTVVRAAVLTAVAFWTASSWGTSLVWLVPKLIAGTGGVFLGFLLLGEWRGEESARVVRAFRDRLFVDDEP